MRMRSDVLVLGAVFLFSLGVFFTVALPLLTITPEPSEAAQRSQGLPLEGRQIYIREGCWYCHTQQVRGEEGIPVPGDEGLGRVSEPGDYFYQSPVLLGTERTGPDLTWEGDRLPSAQWQLTHLRDPQARSPGSLMPSFAHLPENELEALVAYLLSLRGGLMAEEEHMEMEMEHEEVPPEYADVVNPFPGDEMAIAAGREIYKSNCAPCHGVNGDGRGPAAAYLDPPPANFTDAMMMAEVSEAMMFWRINEGVHGTGMPPWEDRLSEEEMWQVINYERTFAE